MSGMILSDHYHITFQRLIFHLFIPLSSRSYWIHYIRPKLWKVQWCVKTCLHRMISLEEMINHHTLIKMDIWLVIYILQITKSFTHILWQWRAEIIFINVDVEVELQTFSTSSESQNKSWDMNPISCAATLLKDNNVDKVTISIRWITSYSKYLRKVIFSWEEQTWVLERGGH